MKLSDLPGIKIGDKVAITIKTDKKKSTTVVGVLVGINNYFEDKVALQLAGLQQWIYLEDGFSVSWAE